MKKILKCLLFITIGIIQNNLVTINNSIIKHNPKNLQKKVLLLGIDGLDIRALDHKSFLGLGNYDWFSTTNNFLYKSEFAIPTYESKHGWASMLYGRDFTNLPDDITNNNKTFFRTLYDYNSNLKQKAIADWPYIFQNLTSHDNFLQQELTPFYHSYAPSTLDNPDPNFVGTQVTANLTIDAIKDNNDVIFSNFEQIDEMGHHGFFYWLPNMAKLYKTLDNKIAEINQLLDMRREMYNEDWMLIISEDHSRDFNSINHSQGSAYAQRSFAISNKNLKQLNNDKEVSSLFDIKNIINKYMIS